mgnify:FL=1
MGAAGLIEIKRRLKSVESTKKITNAMGLVATSKLRKCRKELSINEQYLEIAEKTMKSLARISEEKLTTSYFDGNDGNYKLYIIITSDTGLCAGYNNNVVAFLDSLIKDDKDNCKIISVGSKGISYLRRNGLETIDEYVDIPDIPTIKEVKLVYEKALKLFVSGEVSEVNVVYTEFVSPIKQEVKSEKLLPVERAVGEVDRKSVV